MTRNDFELIADVLRRFDPPVQGNEGAIIAKAMEELCGAFADRFQLANPRFNRTRFLKACGVEG